MSTIEMESELTLRLSPCCKRDFRRQTFGASPSAVFILRQQEITDAFFHRCYDLTKILKFTDPYALF
jgi:hypothetical protein